MRLIKCMLCGLRYDAHKHNCCPNCKKVKQWSSKDLLYVMLDFCEENWAAFLQRCVESGFHEEEVDEAIEAERNKR